MTNTEQLSALANFTVMSFVILVNCLRNQGALGERQLEQALRATIEAPGAARERLDYVLLANLLNALEKQEPGKPPQIEPLH